MGRGSWKIRILIGLAIVAFAFIQRCNNKEENPYTGRVQNINMTAEQEIAIGLQSAPEMAQQHGGLYPDKRMQAFVDAVGQRLVQNNIARETPYKYDFHLLADDRTINAFALPGGQCFITYALFSQLNEAQLGLGIRFPDLFLAHDIKVRFLIVMTKKRDCLFRQPLFIR